MEYEIRKPVIKSEPVIGKFYTDRDNDLFLFTGDGEFDAWLHISNSGAFNRSHNYPTQPLTELARDEIADAVSRSINF